MSNIHAIVCYINNSMKLLIIGAGAWGTALACHTSAAHEVQLWARSASAAHGMQQGRVNSRYLPGIPLPERLTVAAAPKVDFASLAMAQSLDLVVLAVPVSGVREWLLHLADCSAPVVWLCKGLEHRSAAPGVCALQAGRTIDGGPASSGAVWGAIAAPTALPTTTAIDLPIPTPTALLVHEVAAAVAPRLRVGALSGPSFAQEVAAGLPCALVAASPQEAVRKAMAQAFHGGNLRVYENDDLLGVELGGAVKNVYAIAAGLCDGMQLGQNARAALLTRAMAELTRFGLAMGAKSETFLGLSGMGDLLLTATGDLSRNRQVGLAMARGQTVLQATASLGHVAEGVLSAAAVAWRARQVGANMPIVATVVDILNGQLQPKEAVAALLARPLGQE